MSKLVDVIGVDPGGTTGIAVVCVEAFMCPARVVGVQVWQAGDPEAALYLVEARVRTAQNAGAGVLIAIEKWTARQVAQSVRTGDRHTAAEFLNELTVESARVARGRADGSIQVVERAAGQVKPWGTDARLIASGGRFAGMPHGRDALRCALYAAVKDLGAVDPLSRKATIS